MYIGTQKVIFEYVDHTSDDEYMVELPEVQEAEIPTPEYHPPEFSSEDEEISEDEGSVPIQSHANIDLVTFDSLNSHTIQKLWM